jgi:uncharacterized protein (TIGR03437 family)
LTLLWSAAFARAQGVTPQSIITTLAGGSWQFRGDGGSAANAPLGFPRGMAVDSAGNLYVGDGGNHIVVKVSLAGILTVVAGNGIDGYSGDGGSATSASLRDPRGVAVDAAGNLYIMDFDSPRVRKVSPSGIITTVAGNGEWDFTGDGGPALGASFRDPHGVAVDTVGNLYIADSSNHRIRMVRPDGIITTVAGNGIEAFAGDGGPATAASLRFPTGVAVDAGGVLYIADAGNGRVRRVAANGVITTVAGGPCCAVGDGGPATAATLENPGGVAVVADGSLYLADAPDHRIRRVSPQGIITTVVGNGIEGFSGDGGPATGALVRFPGAVAVGAAGELYVADTENRRVRRIGSDGVITTVAGTGIFKYGGDGNAATSASLNFPRGVTVDAGGNVYIADTDSHRIRRVAPNGIITTVAGNGIRGFSGDGGPATQAQLNFPTGVAVDGAGNLYIADHDNNLVRKVSALGVISTVAGNGMYGFAGDAGPATEAAFFGPEGVAVDGNGNLLIADSGNHRIRRVNSSGVIATVAGNGNPGFSGDQGPALSASLNEPSAVVVDAGGNLFVADSGNFRVRRVSSGGFITTVAGTGNVGFAGDGGSAVNAELSVPLGLAVDASGNLYIADTLYNARIRRVSPSGIITAVAGKVFGGDPPFSGDGGPAIEATLANPWGVAVDAAGNVYIADTLNDRIRKVSVTAPVFVANPPALSFTAPAGASEAAPQRITVLSDAAGLPWSAVTTTESGGNWLSVAPPAGQAPGVIVVSVNASALSPGTYRGTITVSSFAASPPVRTVAVTLTAGPALAPRLVAEPLTLTYEIPLGTASPPAKTLRISNGGGGTISWTAQAETSSGGNWLEISPASGSVSPGMPIAAQVRVAPASLAAGVYTGAIRLASPATGETLTVPVTLLIEPPTRTILLSQSGLAFTGVEGGAAVPAQSFGIANVGEGEMSWTVEATTLSGGPNWLTVSPREGRSQAGSLRIPQVEVGVNAAGLPAGQYNGLLRVNALGASNAPQFVAVTLDILPRGSNPGIAVRPTGMIFAAQAGTFSPGSQTVRLSTVAAGQIEVRSGVFTEDGRNWIEILPTSAIVSADDSRTIVVQPKVQGLAAGVYHGQLALAFSDGSPTQRVEILFLVVAEPVPLAIRESGLGNAASDIPNPEFRIPNAGQSCAPRRLHAVYRTLADNFQTPVGWPSPLEVLVADDCGGPVSAATVVASFSNGDPPLLLASLGNGVYVGTWRPVTALDQVLVTVRAESPPLEGVQLRSQVQVRPNPSVPALFAGGIVNAASYAAGEPVAPGGIIALFGRNLAQGENHASQLPLEKTLGGATVNIGGIETPLYFSTEGQINAQVPFELAPNTRPHVVVRTARAGGAQLLTLPETITVAAARPAIFAVNEQGFGQGAILNQNFSPNSAANPAAPRSVIQVFATGLGSTQPAVPSGQPAPASPLSHVAVAVEARIGDRPARVDFAGLAPNYVGLYQVNVEIPAEVQPGSAVPLVLYQGGVPSNTVTVAIQ